MGFVPTRLKHWVFYELKLQIKWLKTSIQQDVADTNLSWTSGSHVNVMTHVCLHFIVPWHNHPDSRSHRHMHTLFIPCFIKDVAVVYQHLFLFSESRNGNLFPFIACVSVILAHKHCSNFIVFTVCGSQRKPYQTLAQMLEVVQASILKLNLIVTLYSLPVLHSAWPLLGQQ